MPFSTINCDTSVNEHNAHKNENCIVHENIAFAQEIDILTHYVLLEKVMFINGASVFLYSNGKLTKDKVSRNADDLGEKGGKFEAMVDF